MSLTPFISVCFLPSITQAFKATTHTTTVAVHVPDSMASAHPKNEPKMDPSPPSPVQSTVTNALKEENRGGDGPCETIEMATKEEKVLGIVLTKEDDNKRRLKISTNENDATTKVEIFATAEGYEHIGEEAVL